ncbi:N-acetylglucosamine-6-phosphate deacetylase [Anoxybacillus sp. UARK-01]|uniref:N-acetylglucosamine-6-phosphate deacetylase n=1 Tax=Anoxybacillus sp. UARK-01 TaxID=1895648 RepID=UPI0009BB4C38|nr:N-acetylglucosamine-6-phosphate deacetylase [Anoxybacillus sp. UARK-01]OQM46136.1 N-acetylglucosamine-6-phosphate deacetylase [Anoxybacillus sp. UARK-01]
MDQFLLKNATIYAENEQIQRGYLLIENGKIAYVGPTPPPSNAKEFELSIHDCVLPGFIDLHIHGAAGADVMDATVKALQTMASVLPKEGTTSFLATTMTAASSEIEKAVKNVANYMAHDNRPGEAEVLGIHLEGPFLSPKRAGAQHPRNIIKPDIELFKKWQKEANGHIRLVTLAPEEENGLSLTAYLKETGVIASIGHSDAVYAEVKEAIQAGVTQATHLFNGMRGLHHREPGVVGAVLMHEEVLCEIIADGIHVAPEMVRFAYRNKGSEGLIAITDAMRAKCLGEGQYDLGGQQVTVRGKQATLKDGTLAGSILKLKDAVKNIMEFTRCSLEEAIRMASWNPAKQLGILDRKGSILPGKDADIVVLNQEREVILTFCRGRLAYAKQEVLRSENH